MIDVTAIGELLIDFTSTGKGGDGSLLYARHPGGAPANVLAANAKLGGKTAFIGKVGNDDFGLYLRDCLAGLGIRTEGLIISDRVHTTLAFVTLKSDGERSFSFYRNPGADMMLYPEEIDMQLIEECRILHFGSVSLTNEPARLATIKALEVAKGKKKIISYDPNYRPLLWSDKKLAQAIMKLYIPFADILKVSDDELFLLTGENDVLRGAKLLADQGVALVLISMGEKGSFFYKKGEHDFVPGFSVEAIDTNGAGDTFLGAIHYKLKDYSIADINRLEKKELKEILLFANASASLTTRRNGAMSAMPTLDEVNNHLKDELMHA
jgi:fructokinase